MVLQNTVLLPVRLQDRSKLSKHLLANTYKVCTALEATYYSWELEVAFTDPRSPHLLSVFGTARYATPLWSVTCCALSCA